MTPTPDDVPSYSNLVRSADDRPTYRIDKCSRGFFRWSKLTPTGDIVVSFGGYVTRSAAEAAMRRSIARQAAEAE